MLFRSDSLIAKLAVHSKDRCSAIERMKKVLQEYYIDGIMTTIPFHIKVMQNPVFINGGYSIKFVEEEFDDKKKISSDSEKDDAFPPEEHVLGAHGCYSEIH